MKQRVCFRALKAHRSRRYASANALQAMEASGKVEVIPFRISEVELWAKAVVVPAYIDLRQRFPSLGRWGLLRKGLILSWQEDWLSTWSVKARRAIYVPVWLFHASTRFQTRMSSSEKSKTWAMWTNTLSMPGFTWSPLDQLPVVIDGMPLQELEPFNVQKHTGNDITVLPFSRSPLSLPPKVQKLAEEQPDLAAAVKVAEGLNDPHYLAMQANLERDFRQTSGNHIAAQTPLPAVTVEPSSLDTKMAAYPILVPLYLYEFEEGKNKQRYTVAFRGDTAFHGVGNLKMPFWSLWGKFPSPQNKWWPNLFSEDNASVSYRLVKEGELGDDIISVPEVPLVAAGVVSRPRPGEEDKLSPEEIKIQLEALDFVDDLVSSIRVSDALQSLLMTTRNVLEEGEVSSWASHPAVMKYSETGRFTAELVQRGKTFTDDEFEDWPREMDWKNPPKKEETTTCDDKNHRP